MLETLIGLVIVGLFCVLAWAVRAGVEALVVAGLGLAAVGFAYGIPAALVYHWLLHRALSRADRLPPRWWISPTSHHALVPEGDRRRVLFWAVVGGTGFLVIVLGILLCALGIWRAREAA